MISSSHPSATANPEPVEQEMERALSLNRKAGLFLALTFSKFVWSGAIPKKHSDPPKWRIIKDLSWPAGQSVNDVFAKELYTCSYDSMDQAIPYLKLFGVNAVISKLDLSDAFHHILVDPNDWEILGSTLPLVMSDGSTRTGYFFNTLLPLGLRNSPALFLKFVNGLRYTMALHGTPYVLGLWPSRPKRRLFFES